MILPDPHRVTVYELVRFSLDDEDLIYLEDSLQDILTLGYDSEFFMEFLETLQYVLYVC